MNVIDQIYNGAALLEEHHAKDRTDTKVRRRLRIAMFRMRNFLDDSGPLGCDQDEAAIAYMAGYEDESK